MNIRTTPQGWFSIFDVINYFYKDTNNDLSTWSRHHAKNTWRLIKEKLPTEFSRDDTHFSRFKFAGKGQRPTPVGTPRLIWYILFEINPILRSVSFEAATNSEKFDIDFSRHDFLYIENKYQECVSIVETTYHPEVNKELAAKRGYLYLAFSTYSQLLKIGFSLNPEKRLQTLQTGSPEPLVLLGTLSGTMTEERRLQEKYKKDHSHLEWYRYNPKLVDEFVKPALIQSIQGQVA